MRNVSTANSHCSQSNEKGPMPNPDITIFRVDESSDLPIWAQIRNRIAYLIRTGHFKAGEQLPSVRTLAAEARINYNTVAKAYRDLELEGLIVSIRGRGMFVQKNVIVDESAGTAVDALLENCIEQYRAHGMSYADIRERMDSIVDQLESKARSAEEEKQDYGTLQ